MEAAIGISAARWVVTRALGPITDGLLEPWAASSQLGAKIHALKMELLYAQGMLDNARGRDVRSPALAQLLLELRQLAYSADDVLDELEYFRIQDELNGTYETTDADARGLVKGLVLNARHTAKAVASKLKLSSCSCAAGNYGEEEEGKQGCLSRCSENAQDANGGCLRKVIASGARASDKRFPCCSHASVSNPQHGYSIVRAPALKFDRVGMSNKMADIVEQLKPICAKVSTILGLELSGLNRTTTQQDPFDRPKTTPQIVEPKIYGRESHISSVVQDIAGGKYSASDLTVLSVFGLGGMGKTTFTQHIYDKVKMLFQVPVWICVSHDFSANRLGQEILKQIPGDSNEKGSAEEIIEKTVKSKQFLLVLDDMWTYHEDEWKKLLTPFKKGGTKGNMVIVTTRIPGVAKAVGRTDCLIKLDRLEHKDCMDLFQACVFGDQKPWKDQDGLHETGRKIVDMLKGSPLAVKTVGRLLRTQLNIEHWNSILESKEWELQASEEDIMPALNLSYNYLPFPVQQCFSHCALFPEDYEFTSKELIRWWIGLGLLGNSDQNKRIEDIGQNYLNILVDHGFFEKSERENEDPHYVIHDLLHELAVKASSFECLSIGSSNMRSINIPASIRHLSITINDMVVMDRTTFQNFKIDLSKLGKRLKAENLRTLMLFGEYHGSFVKVFHDLFKEAKSLRVISLSGVSYNVKDLFHNFLNLVHLRHLRINVSYYYTGASLPCSISRFYHLMVLDAQGHLTFPPDMSNLVKLRHFIVPSRFHSEISMVGKLNVLQELQTFEIKRELKGFGLDQLGQLGELKGSLSIYNLDSVQSIGEADEAKLAHKNLHKLTLNWSTDVSGKDPRQEENVLRSLKPNNNLRALCVRGNGGATCPTWLGVELSIENLERLHLENVSWSTLPPLGNVCMVDEHGTECAGSVPGQGFKNLKILKLVDIPKLKRWSANGICHFLSHLEKLVVRDCRQLIELPFPRSSCDEPEQEENMTMFPKLRKLSISGCPNLLSLPPIPWNSSLCSVYIYEVGPDFKHLSYSKDEENCLGLLIEGKGAQDIAFWNVLAFNNLTGLQELRIFDCPPVPLHRLQMLKSLESLSINRPSLPIEGGSNIQYKFPVKKLCIEGCRTSGKELTRMLSHFPCLSELWLNGCDQVSGLGVAVKELQANSMEEEEEIRSQQRQTGDGEDMETTAEGLLLLPPQIKELIIRRCSQLSHRSSSLGGGAGRGLQGLHSLQSLNIAGSPKLLSSNLSSYFLFPASLQTILLYNVQVRLTLPPLPNLTELNIQGARNLRGEDLLPLRVQSRLTNLKITGAPKFFLDLEPSRLSGIPCIITDDIAGLLVRQICSVLSSSLTYILFIQNSHLESFTKDQEKALQMLTSLTQLDIRFFSKLQSAPSGLTGHPSLKILEFWSCQALQSLSKDSLPSSLEELAIGHCPQLRSLPEDGLPDTLRKLDLRGTSKELLRQCRKLKGTIPIIQENQ